MQLLWPIYALVLEIIYIDTRTRSASSLTSATCQRQQTGNVAYVAEQLQIRLEVDFRSHHTFTS